MTECKQWKFPIKSAIALPPPRQIILHLQLEKHAGFWDSYEALVRQRQIDRVFELGVGRNSALANFTIWKNAVERVKHWVE